MTKGDELEVKTSNGTTITVTVENESECRSCGEPIVWCITKNGKKMPVDIEDEGDWTMPLCHFATCAHADQWRKKP
jgi:hypothetical protein